MDIKLAIWLLVKVIPSKNATVHLVEAVSEALGVAPKALGTTPSRASDRADVP